MVFPMGVIQGDSGLRAQPLYDAICGHSASVAQVHPSSPGRQVLLEKQTD